MASSTTEDQPFDRESARQAWQEGADKIGRFNLAIFGKTGVGKSTLINAIFGDNVAQTGIGEPVTQGSHLYITTSGALGLYDTKGIEIGQSAETILQDLRDLVHSKRTADAGEHIHAVYYCIRASDRRLEPAEVVFINGLHELDLPVFLVLTQVHRKNGVYRQDHMTFADYLYQQNLPVHSGRPFLTAALPDTQLGYEAFGLEELLQATDEKAPEAVQTALATAQVIDLTLKHKAATKVIAAAATGAAAIGASPVPFSDAALLVPAQMAMMAQLARIYRIPMDAALAASLGATALATNAGKALAGGILKMLPGVNVAAMAASAAVAGAFTIAMGNAWRSVCVMILQGKFGPVEDLDLGALKSVFMDRFKQNFTPGAVQEFRQRSGEA